MKLRLVSTSPELLATIGHEADRYELSRARQLARSWAETLPEPRRRDMAALFTQTAFEAYRLQACPDALFSSPFCIPHGKLDRSVAELAKALGNEATSLPIAEAAHYLTGLYTALLASRERSAMGAFYTPPVLAERLLDLAEEQGIDWTKATVLDPASGGGAFLLPAALRMRSALRGSDPALILKQIGARLAGFELDAYAAWFGQAALEIALSDLSLAARKPVPVIVRVTDTLEETPRKLFDVVIGNPPYGRVALTAAQRVRYKRSLYGHANLYGVFTDIAVRWVKTGGIIAYLTPTSVLSGQYYSALRLLLATEAPPVSIDFVHARSGVFEDVLQETLLAIYRRGKKAARVQVHYIHMLNEREAKLVRNGTIGLPKVASQPWLAPREPSQAPLIKAAEKMPCRLSDWGYSVSTGPLVWNRFKDQLRDRPSKGALPLIWAESITSVGQFKFRAERKNHAPFFKVERGDDWLVAKDGCVLIQRTTAKEQPRRLIAAELPRDFIGLHNGVVIENHLNMVRPTGKPSVSPATIAAVLNSDIVDQLFRCISGSVAVSAFELEAIPLPSLAAVKKLDGMIKRGAGRTAIETELARCYGLEQLA